MGEASAPAKSGYAKFIRWAMIAVVVLVEAELLSGKADLLTLLLPICLLPYLSAVLELAPARLLHGVAPHLAHEAAAIKAIQTIHIMQLQYKSRYGHFAGSLAELGPHASGTPSAAAADLIGKDLASGDTGGYKFTLTGDQDGYIIHANSVKFGVTGTRTFYSDQTMVVHENYGPGPASSTSKALK